MAVHLLTPTNRELQTSQGQSGILLKPLIFLILVTSLGIKVKTNNELKVNLCLSLLSQTPHALVLCLLMHFIYLYILEYKSVILSELHIITHMALRRIVSVAVLESEAVAYL